MLTQAEKRNPTTPITLSQSPRPRLSEEPRYGPVSIKCSKICLRDPQKWQQNNNSRALCAFDRRLHEHRGAMANSSLFVCTSVSFPPSFSPLPPSLPTLSLHLSIWVCLSQLTLLTVSPCKHPSRATAAPAPPSPSPNPIHPLPSPTTFIILLQISADGRRAAPRFTHRSDR